MEDSVHNYFGLTWRQQFALSMLLGLAFSLLYSLTTDHAPQNIFWLATQTDILLFSVFLYPLIEELSFRGVLQSFLLNYPAMQKAYGPITVANLATSLLFVLIHFVHHAPSWALLVFFPSIIFGYFRDRTGRVVPSIALHMFYNLVFLSLIGK